jgi:hypothetical protein
MRPNPTTVPDAPAGERVYAPASERVPREPAPGHREVIQHMDSRTPERETFERRWPDPTDDEPTAPDTGLQQRVMFMAIGLSWLAVTASGVSLWLIVRWRRERNKPVNRMRMIATALLSALVSLKER